MTIGRLQAVATLAAVLLGASATLAQSPKVHRLEATPETVAYGFYWSEAKPSTSPPATSLTLTRC